MPLLPIRRADVACRMPLSVTFFASVLLGQACQAPTIDDGWQAHVVSQQAPAPKLPGAGPRVPVPIPDHDILKPRIMAQLLCARAFAECIGDEERRTFSDLQLREHACVDQLEVVIANGKHTAAQVIKYGQNLQYCFGILLDLLFNMMQHGGGVLAPMADLYCFKCDGKLSHFLQSSNVLVQIPEPERVRADPPRYPGPAFPPDEESDAEAADSRQGRLVSGPLFGLLQEIGIQKQTSMLQAYATLASMPERDFIALEAIATWAGSANGPGLPVLAQTITHAEMLSMTAAEFEAWAADFGFAAVEQNPAAGIKLFSDGDVLALVVRGAVIVLVGGVLVALVLALIASGPPGWAVLAVLASAALLYRNGTDAVSSQAPHL